MTAWHFDQEAAAHWEETWLAHETETQRLEGQMAQSQSRSERHQIQMEIGQLSKPFWRTAPKPSKPEFEEHLTRALSRLGLNVIFDPEDQKIALFWQEYQHQSDYDQVIAWHDYWRRRGLDEVKLLEAFSLAMAHSSAWMAIKDQQIAALDARINAENNTSDAETQDQSGDSGSTESLFQPHESLPPEPLDSRYCHDDIDYPIGSLYEAYKRTKYDFIALFDLCANTQSDPGVTTSGAVQAKTVVERLVDVSWDMDQLRLYARYFLIHHQRTYIRNYWCYSGSRLVLVCECFELYLKLFSDQMARLNSLAGLAVPQWVARYAHEHYEAQLQEEVIPLQAALAAIREIASTNGVYDFLTEEEQVCIESALQGFKAIIARKPW